MQKSLLTHGIHKTGSWTGQELTEGQQLTDSSVGIVAWFKGDSCLHCYKQKTGLLSYSQLIIIHKIKSMQQEKKNETHKNVIS